MTDVIDRTDTLVGTALPERLHHNAYVVLDQERTRAFYEDVLGMPLVQFWIEHTKRGPEDIILSHAFYGMGDGSVLAFFCMGTEELHEKYKSPKSEIFNHIALKVSGATQEILLQRLQASGYQNFTVEHGYCRSLYVTDPDGLMVEFTQDDARFDEIASIQAETAHDTLKRWMAGDRTSNNTWRR